MSQFEENASTIRPRKRGGFLIDGPDMKNIEVYASPNTTHKGAPDRWIMIEFDHYDNSMMIEIECLDNLIKALTSIRDARVSAAA